MSESARAEYIIETLHGRTFLASSGNEATFRVAGIGSDGPADLVTLGHAWTWRPSRDDLAEVERLIARLFQRVEVLREDIAINPGQLRRIARHYARTGRTNDPQLN
jgi:hypothetical protein